MHRRVLRRKVAQGAIALADLARRGRQRRDLALAAVRNASASVGIDRQAAVGIVVDWYTWIEAGQFQGRRPGISSIRSRRSCSASSPASAFFITVFAAGYMKGEAGYFRFFAYLGLFIFAMTILVMGNNLIMLYLGWEGVGLCSYLLIGYYYEKPSAREAAKKAFLVNRIGDFGFGLGIMLMLPGLRHRQLFRRRPSERIPACSNWRMRDQLTSQRLHRVSDLR